MTSLHIGFASIATVLVLLGMRVPIGVALGLTAFAGLAATRGLTPAIGLLKTVPFDFSASWSLTAIPMFLLMGTIANAGGLTSTLFDAARVWLARLPGGLAIATTYASAGFSAASGSSIAAAAAMSRIAIPEMLKQGYDKGLAAASVAAAGTMGSLIPPSVLFVVYGMLAEVSISRLLIAGILPGILTGGVYCVMIVVRCMVNPELAPTVEMMPNRRERWILLARLWPLILLIGGVIGGIYSGLTTPTEAGAVGAALAAIIALVQGQFPLSAIRSSVAEALTITARLFFVAIGAVLFTKLMAISGVPHYLGSLLGDWALDPLWLVIGVSIIYLMLGCFLDPLGLMLVTLPVFLPMFKALDLDLIWFGVLVIKYVEIGLLTPPVGLNLFVVKNAVGDDIQFNEIIKGIGWFLLCEVVIMAFLIGFPAISTYLPSMM